jgi:hypothetical protein
VQFFSFLASGLSFFDSGQQIAALLYFFDAPLKARFSTKSLYVLQNFK